MARGGALLKPAGANNRRSSSASSTSAGAGQVLPITDVRRKYSATVVRPIPTERAIVRTLAPHAYFSPNTSRTFRIDNLPPGSAVPLAGGPRYRSSDRRLRPRTLPSGLSAINRNHWPLSLGIGVRLASESSAAFTRIPHRGCQRRDDRWRSQPSFDPLP